MFKSPVVPGLVTAALLVTLYWTKSVKVSAKAKGDKVKNAVILPGTLQDLALAANKVQDAQRRSRAARERKRRQQQEEQAAEAIAAEPSPVQRWEKPQPARRPRTEQVVATAATRQRARERQVPLWMHRGEPRATTVARWVFTGGYLVARQLQQSRKSTAVSTTRMKRTSLENKSRNVAKRSGESSISSTDAKQRKTGQGPRPSKRRESVQSTASSTNNELSQETMSGRVRYSNLAKENDWVDRELIEAIERDIVDHGEKITFENIAGLEHTKQLLQETVMLPQIAPHLFTDGLLKPCNGVLMFGPPGTGKTLLAKAVAHECGTTFFNVSASTLSSKYRGDSEKMVRILFDMARYYEPSIIFMDEIDAIASARGAATEHEASRRVKTELLVQINGVSSGEHEGSRVMLLAATNLPWELDEAMRRRLTKRVYIPLPGAEARRALFEFNMGKIDVGTDVKLDELVDETEVIITEAVAIVETISRTSAKQVSYDFCSIARKVSNVSLSPSPSRPAKRMPVKRVYTPELLLKMRREIEAGEDFRELETERLVVTKTLIVTTGTSRKGDPVVGVRSSTADNSEPTCALGSGGRPHSAAPCSRTCCAPVHKAGSSASCGKDAVRFIARPGECDVFIVPHSLSGAISLTRRICLTKDWNERRSTLQRMRDQKLRRAYEFVMSTSHLTNSGTTQFSENRFENEQGDLCCVRFDTVHFPGAVSLQQVFDGLSFFMVNMEIIISEELGHVMLCDDYDTIEDEAFHSQFVSTDKRGIIVEGNAISFRHLFSGNDNGYIIEPCGVAIVDCVDDDELYPYRSSERVRRDSSGAIVLTARKMRTSSASGYEEEMVVTMRRATFLKIRRPEFPLSEPALQELHDDMMQWTDVMVKSIRSIVYQKHTENAPHQAATDRPLCNAHPRANVEPRDARRMGSGEVCAGQGAGQIVRQEDPGQRELAQAHCGRLSLPQEGAAGVYGGPGLQQSNPWTKV
ncbi:hypothetical protein ON010_g3722 [Phytophthora cinnamomi]|nr:hypothetical protein ON010_g3722 [Phytophthora cinnamomi]